MKLKLLRIHTRDVGHQDRLSSPSTGVSVLQQDRLADPHSMTLERSAASDATEAPGNATGPRLTSLRASLGCVASLVEEPIYIFSQSYFQKVSPTSEIISLRSGHPEESASKVSPVHGGRLLRMIRNEGFVAPGHPEAAGLPARQNLWSSGDSRAF